MKIVGFIKNFPREKEGIENMFPVREECSSSSAADSFSNSLTQESTDKPYKTERIELLVPDEEDLAYSPLESSITHRYLPAFYRTGVILPLSLDYSVSSSLEEIKSRGSENTRTQENDDEMTNDLPQSLSQSTQEADSAHNPSNIQTDLYNQIVLPLLRDFNLKEENIKQTVVRRFKFCMKKIYQNFNRYKKLSPAKYLKLIQRIMNLYHIDINHRNRDFADNLILDIRYLIDQVRLDNFDAVYKDEKSCNNNYIRNIFSSPIMRELYRLHHLLASQGRIYFEKFKQLNHENLTREDEQQILLFCGKFLEIYIYKFCL